MRATGRTCRFVASADPSFSQLFLLHILEGLGEIDVYKRAHVDRKHFSKIRSSSSYQPTKVTVIAFALALQLSTASTENLLKSAGYSLSKSTEFDLIIRYFLDRKSYDLFQINEALFEFNQPLLLSELQMHCEMSPHRRPFAFVMY